MSAKAQSNWVAMALVAVVSAAIGFGAIYVIVGGGDNRGEREAAAAAGSATAQRASESTAEPAPRRVSGAVLTGADGAPLNRGKMTTFVFKQAPAALPGDLAFNNGKGETVGIDAFKGKVVLMNLWATWCAPCRKEMPDLDRLQAELGSDRFKVVAVSLDRGSPDKARAFLEEVGVKSLAFYHDPDAKIGFKLMAIGMPTTLLIDAEGREIGRLVGPAEWHSDDAQKLVRAAIAAQGS
jgi:thiol-disulfide isomerase/thioredoxin